MNPDKELSRNKVQHRQNVHGDQIIAKAYPVFYAIDYVLFLTILRAEFG